MLFSEMPVKTFAFGCCGQLMTWWRKNSTMKKKGDTQSIHLTHWKRGRKSLEPD